MIGRYALFGEIASGGMATVHVGRLLGPVGFSRTVAIKRLHPQFSRDPDFASMFLDEARLAARIRHPNVVSTLDVVALDGELFLVMDYVEGEALSRLIRRASAGKGDDAKHIPPRVASALIAGALHGLHAAHEAKNERGEPLGLVHRDVSPQNILVGRDGTARVLDFGVAKAVGRAHNTREGSIKGKLPYMAPEQILSGTIDRRTDVYAAGIVLWETLTGRRLFHKDNEGATLEHALHGVVEAPSVHAREVPAELDALVLKALTRDPDGRFGTAKEMALALERTVAPALASDVAEWLEGMAAETMDARARAIAEIESGTDMSVLAIAAAADIPTAAASGGYAAISGGHAAISGPLPSTPSLVSQPGVPDSQVSAISALARPEQESPSSMRRVAPIAVAVILLVVIAGVGAILLGKRAPAATEPLANASASTPPTATPSVTPTAPARSAPEVTASSSAPAPSASTATAATATARPTGHATTKPTATTTATTTGASDDCAVPYTIDAQGNKVYKRQCL